MGELSEVIEGDQENDLWCKSKQLVWGGVMKVMMEAINWFEPERFVAQEVSRKLEKIGKKT